MIKLLHLYRKITSKLHIIFFGRISLLRKLGGKVGNNCRFIGEISFGSEPYLIKIGDNVSITSSHFVNHDGGVWVFRRDFPEIDVIKPINIGDNVFIGSHCIIMPGVTIGSNVVVGAGSIITKDLDSDGVYAGVPAKYIKSLADYKKSSLENNLKTKGSLTKKNYLINHYKIK
ncbi:acyltransferase [Pseudoalteromonas sp. Z9A4]|jgi:acetyltransferase-like isoleucine patch superfamily enzyme|uniref:acyltransferase n=1 Tax=Pseudoalteromonas sp. Z9A4 TaxID=2686353 RepID=UPI00140789C1|nr:acyltransferase [Pseudoalteromonas sp. Z9A4]